MKSNFSNTLYLLDKTALNLKNLEATNLSETHRNHIYKWRKVIQNLDQHIRDSSIDQSLNQVLFARALEFLEKPLFAKLENLIEQLLQDVACFSNLLSDIEFEIKKLETVTQYYAYVQLKLFFYRILQTPHDDLFCRDQNTDPDWQLINQNVNYVDVSKVISFIQQLSSLDEMDQAFFVFKKSISIGAAYVAIGEQTQLKGFTKALVQNLGGAFYVLNIEKARQLNIKMITNPTLQFSTGLWNIMGTFIPYVYSLEEKAVIIKTFVKCCFIGVNFHEKIYIPKLFQAITLEKLLQEIETKSKNRDLLIKHQQVDSLIEKNLKEVDLLLRQPLQQKDRSRVKVRILSANKSIWRKSVDLNAIKEVLSGNMPAIQKEEQEIKKIILHIHGGGWVAMSSFSHQIYTRKWANWMGKDTIIFSIDYRLAPDSPYPLALDDCWQLYLWIVLFYNKYDPIQLNFSSFYMKLNLDKIVIAGDSAGGNMALGVIYRAIKFGVRVPEGLFLSYPALEVDENMYIISPNFIQASYTPSLLNSLIDTLVPFTILQIILDSYIKPKNQLKPREDLYLCPGVASEPFLKQQGILLFYLSLPKIIMTCGDLDPLRDECLRYFLKLIKCGADVKFLIYRHLGHGYMNYEIPIFAVPQVKQVILQSFEILKELFI